MLYTHVFVPAIYCRARTLLFRLGIGYPANAAGCPRSLSAPGRASDRGLPGAPPRPAAGGLIEHLRRFVVEGPFSVGPSARTAPRRSSSAAAFSSQAGHGLIDRRTFLGGILAMLVVPGPVKAQLVRQVDQAMVLEPVCGSGVLLSEVLRSSVHGEGCGKSGALVNAWQVRASTSRCRDL